MTVYTGGWQLAPDYDTNALIADVGLYTGPWPPATRLAQNLPLDAGEIDYLVAIPNPNGRVDDVANGRYPTCWRDVGMFWTGSPGGPIDTFDTHTRSAGGAPLVEAVPPGAHLFILWYGVSFGPAIDLPQPSVAPQVVVPKGWCQGARGWSQQPSHWSDWLPGYEVEFDVELDEHFCSSDRSQNSGAATAQPIQSSFDAGVDLLKAGIGDDASLGGSPLFNSINFLETRQDAFNPGGAQWGISIASMSANFTGADHLAEPPPTLPAFPPDAGDPAGVPALPNTYEIFNFEGADNTFTGWDDLELPHRILDLSSFEYDYSAVGPFYVDGGTVGTSYTPPSSFEVSVGFGPQMLIPAGDPIATDPYDHKPIWPGPPAGTTPTMSDLTQLGHLSLPAVVSSSPFAPFTALGNPSEGSRGRLADDEVNLTVPMGAADTPNLNLMMLPRAVDDIDFATYVTPDSQFTGWSATVRGPERDGDLARGFMWAGATLTMRARTPRYRYWVAGAPIPPGDVSYLRMQQRDDGLGPSGHPRLSAGNSPSSRQRAHAPRIGDHNTYS